jgi:MerR family transcriptional regulator, light-induced transcriptional regulator
MLESPHTGSRDYTVQADDSVVELASRALSVLSARVVRSEVAMNPRFVEALHDAALQLQGDAFAPVLDAMHKAGIADRQIADDYLPLVARKLGEEWCEDSKTFADVTIGVAQLQRLLHDLGPEWRADIEPAVDAPVVLLLIKDGADHTFGARILVGQLRRRGLTVRLVVDARPKDIRSLMHSASFDAVMISASISEALAPLTALIDAIKSSGSRVPPIILGGQICASDLDLKTSTGADYVTSDVDEAVRLCQLDLPRPNRAMQAKKR